MNAPGESVLSISAEQSRHCVDAYIEAWNEPDADKRVRTLAQVMTADGTYTDPAAQTDGPARLAEHIGRVRDRDAGRRVVRTSEVDTHNLVCRFNWRVLKADGTQTPESVDFVEFSGDGTICRVTGFFGPLPPIEAARQAAPVSAG